MAGSNHIDLLLIGKTGNGKSATGNSILNREAFKSDDSSSSVTTDIQYEVSEFNGRIVKVVDGPGVGDTRLNTDDAIKMMVKEMGRAIAINPRGYHAFILVVKFGGRFTEEDQDTVKFLKIVFGPDFVKNFCILLMTCGDIFEGVSKRKGITFAQWCTEQTGQLQTLMNECDNRVVLFDNFPSDEAKKDKQIENLLQVVDNLKSRGKRYTDANFAKAQKARDRYIVESKKPVIQEETMTETSLILAQIEKVQENTDLNIKIKRFEQLQVRVASLLKSLSDQDQGTGALSDLISLAEKTKSNISEQIKLCEKMIVEREDAKQREATDKRAMEELEEKHRQEQEILKKEREEMEQLYNEAKKKHSYGFLDGLVDVLTLGITALVRHLKNK